MKKSNTQKQVQTQIKDLDLIRKKHLQLAKGASKLFVRKGYYQTSIRDILKITDFTTGNLYNYISKKEDILYLVFDVFQTIWVTRLEEAGVFGIEDPVEQLKTAIKKMLELVDSNREMVLLMYTESKSLPKNFLRAGMEKESRLVEYFEKILLRGLEKGVFKIKDPFLSANIIVYLLSIEPLRGWNLRKRFKTEEINSLLEKYIMESVLKLD
jgi:AcrR family transcriptional regulator